MSMHVNITANLYVRVLKVDELYNLVRYHVAM